MKLTSDTKFLFFTMMQAAIKMKNMGRGKKDFVNFAAEIWESMLINDTEELKNTLFEGMMADLKEYVDAGDPQNAVDKNRI